MQEIFEKFDDLGKPEHVGHCFSITAQGIKDYGLLPSELGTKLPRPDYEHRIYRDTVTNHYLVVRPMEDGTYDGWFEVEKLGERLR